MSAADAGGSMGIRVVLYVEDDPVKPLDVAATLRSLERWLGER
ncbi:hypothetical protein [Roseateles sp.]